MAKRKANTDEKCNTRTHTHTSHENVLKYSTYKQVNKHYIMYEHVSNKQNHIIELPASVT